MAELTGAPRVDLVARRPSPAAEALALLVAQLGARPALVAPEAVRPDRERAAAIVLEGLGDALLAALRPAPTLAVAADGAALASVAAACGLELEAGERVAGRTYDVAAHEPAVWPLAGLRLQEAADRRLATIRGGGTRALVTARGRAVVASLPASGVLVTTVAPWTDAPPPHLLRRALSPWRFLDTLPALVLVRQALGDRGWRRPSAQAIAIVDAANLARPSYGYLDYRQAAPLAADFGFHLAVGFVPLDFARTDRAVARLFAEHPSRLSLLVHGERVRRPEPAVADEAAALAVRQALARMRRHRELTGLDCEAVVTAPDGVTPASARAMREAGCLAALASSAYAWRGDATAGRVTELTPASMDQHGMPVLARWPLDESLHDVLFGAFWGQPACVHTHHRFLGRGWDGFLDAVGTLNRQLAPAWAPAGEIARGNQLVRRVDTTLHVRAFSNELRVHVPDWADRVELEQLGERIPWQTERVLIDGRPAAETERSDSRIAATVVPGEEREMRVRFASTLEGGPVHGWERSMLTSRARRLIVETRDRLVPVLA